MCNSPYKKGLPANKQRLSRWIVDAISTTCESSDLPSPLGVRAHSTKGMSASMPFHLVYRWTIFATLQDGPPLWPLSDSTALTLMPLLAPQSSLPKLCRSTLGRDLTVWGRGHFGSQSISMVPRGNDTHAILPLWICRCLHRRCFYSFLVATSSSDISRDSLGQITHFSEHGTTGAFLKHFWRSISFPRWTMVTYVTWDIIPIMIFFYLIWLLKKLLLVELNVFIH